MKIVGGSMGFGSARVGMDGRINIKGTASGNYTKDQVKDFDIETIKQKKFGVTGFILGSLLLGGIGVFFFGIIGLVVAIVICVFGSFYSTTHYQLRIAFDDGNKITLKASKGETEHVTQALK